MTVEQLIEKLKAMPQSADVDIEHEHGGSLDFPERVVYEMGVVTIRCEARDDGNEEPHD